MPERRVISRRRAIQLAVAGGTVGLAGCEGGSNGSGGSNRSDAGSSSRKEYKWKVAHWLPPDHPLIKEGLNPLMKKTKENLSDTPYDVKFNVFPGGQLGDGSEMLQMAQNTDAVLTLISPSYLKGALSLSGVGSLPTLYQTAMSSSLALFEMIENGGILFENDFKPKGVRPVYISNITPYQLNGVQKKVVKLTDFKGRKVRTPGGIQTEALQQLGATSVTTEASDLSSAMQRGTVSMTVSPIASIEGHGWQKILEWSTTNADIGGFPFSFAMNLDYFNSLPKAVQNALMNAGRPASRSGGKAYDRIATTFPKKVDGKSVDFYELSKENRNNWEKQLIPIVDNWITNTKNKSLPAQKTVNQYKKFVKKYAQ